MDLVGAVMGMLDASGPDFRIKGKFERRVYYTMGTLRDLNIFAGSSPYLCTLVGQLDIFCRAYILTYCPDLCWGVCVMLAQGHRRAKPSALVQ